MPKRKYQTPEILQDAPLRDEKLADFHFDDFAATFARLIASPKTETPLAIGINGAWGSGKTSLLMRVKNMLDVPVLDKKHRFAEGEEKDFRKCKTVWFDAWKYGGEDQILAALLRVIVAEMQRDGFWNWLKAQSQANKEELKWFDLLADSLLQFASAGVYSLNIGDYRVDTPLKQASAFFDYFDDSLTKLLATWVGGKIVGAKQKGIAEEKGVLVIFIDDLDRCLPDKAVQTLEALKLFMDKRGCVFVIGADTKIVQMAVETHYKNVGITGESAKDYLEKIIQLRFNLPLILDEAMAMYLRSETKVDEAMQNRWRTLIAAAEVNPRRAKNVINDLNLQWVMAQNSGQAERVSRDDFICWQALMHAAPAKFIKRIMDFEDIVVRYNFVLEAVKWQTGSREEKEAAKGSFGDYEDEESRRLRKVLKHISFSMNFAPDTLAAMIYMTAPPITITGVVGMPSEEVFTPMVTIPMPELTSGTESVIFSKQSRRLIGGIEFVRVPKGRFIMGSKDDNELASDDETPQHTLDISYDYWMAKFILTNEQYAQYLGSQNHPVNDWQKKKDHPVVNVSWNDVMKCCQWFNQAFQSELGDLLVRLPTEAEWEKAARGAYGNEWPWGNEFDKNKCNSSEGGKGDTTPVGLYSAAGGDSPYGCSDMAGNVWEWTHTVYKNYPYVTGDGREDEKSHKSGDSRVQRGGSFGYSRQLARCAFRYDRVPVDSSRNGSVGFRLVASFPFIFI